MNMRRSRRSRSSSSPWVTTVGPAMVRPKKCSVDGPGAPGLPQGAVDDALVRRGQVEPAPALGEVHPRQAEVVLEAAEGDRVAAVALVDQAGGQLLDESGRVGHGAVLLERWVAPAGRP